jgi:hypothetical protein
VAGAFLDVLDVIESLGCDHGMWKSGKLESEGLMAARRRARRKRENQDWIYRGNR